jgi:hypothetical protein
VTTIAGNTSALSLFAIIKFLTVSEKWPKTEDLALLDTTDGTGEDATFLFPVAIAADLEGAYLYVVDFLAGQVRAISINGGLPASTSTIMGSQLRALVGTVIGADVEALLYGIIGYATGSGAVDPLVGTLIDTDYAAERNARSATLTLPTAVVCDRPDRVLVASFLGHYLIAINITSGVTTFAAGNLSTPEGDPQFPLAIDGPGDVATFGVIKALAYSPSDDSVFAVDSVTHALRRIDSKTLFVSTLIDGIEGSLESFVGGSSVDGTVGMSFKQPLEIHVGPGALDYAQRLYILQGDGLLREFREFPQPSLQTVVGGGDSSAGGWPAKGYADANGLAARFGDLECEFFGLGVLKSCGSGNATSIPLAPPLPAAIYFADPVNCRVRALDVITNDVTTLAGGGPLDVNVYGWFDFTSIKTILGFNEIPPGCGYTDGANASFLAPQAVVAGNGFVYVADTFNSV